MARTAARMGARAAHIESGNRTAIIAMPQHRPRREQLIELQPPMQDVAAGQPEHALQIERVLRPAADEPALRMAEAAHGEVAQLYDVFNDEAGFANRGTFLIDSDGVIRFAEMNPPGQGRDAQKWREAIEALPWPGS